jgi:hypothetical protein
MDAMPEFVTEEPKEQRDSTPYGVGNLTGWETVVFEVEEIAEEATA